MMNITRNFKNLFHVTQPRRKLAAAIGLSLLMGVSSAYPLAAETIQQKINQIQSQNNNLQAQNNNLAAEAAGFEATIANLQTQITALEAQIQANETRRQELLVKIAQTEAEIVHQKSVLGQNIKAMYLEDNISTLEMLASSNDLSQFVDKEQYRNTVQAKIKNILDTITQLKAQLEAQKAEVEKILVDQRAIQSQLDAQRAEQARMLALNQAERNNLDAQMRANSGRISELRRQQAAENARLFGRGLRQNVPDTTGYPWAGVAFPNSSPDPWGMYKRQCVSYTAWKVWKSGRYMPYWGGHGNANQWDDNARAAGIPVDRSPRVGDVAVSNSGTYGHVMYVEAVYGDGTIYISQYNAGWDGRYSEARISIGSLVFIHF